MRQLVDGSHSGQGGAFRLHRFHEDVTGVFQRRKRNIVAVGIERVAHGTPARVGSRVGDGAGDGEIQLGRSLSALNRIVDRRASAGRRAAAAGLVFLRLDGAEGAEGVAAADGRHGGS